MLNPKHGMCWPIVHDGSNSFEPNIHMGKQEMALEKVEFHNVSYIKMILESIWVRVKLQGFRKQKKVVMFVASIQFLGVAILTPIWRFFMGAWKETVPKTHGFNGAVQWLPTGYPWSPHESFMAFSQKWLPSGECLHFAMERSTMLLIRENPLFLWPFSMAFCMFTRG